MTVTDYLLHVFYLIDTECEALNLRRLIRTRGPQPTLSDSEVITMELAGEFLGIDTDNGSEFAGRAMEKWACEAGVKLDFRHLPDGYVATAKDVEAELKRIGHTLAPLEIVVVNTSAGAKYGRQDYVTSGCGMGYEATMYLLERGVRLTGIDGWSWDAPFVYTAKKYAETKDASLIWEGHKAGRHIGYCHIEKLHNLELLPPTGFTVSCFPVKIERASAGWTRAVAIIEG